LDAIDKVKEFLDPYGLRIIELEESTRTADLAAQALGVEVGQIAKTLAFVGKTKAVLVVTSGDTRIDNKSLRKTVGEKMRMASPEEALELTGYAPGGVCPFGVAQDLRVLIDLSMERFPVVYAAAGTPNSAVPVSVEQLLTITGGTPCRVSQIQS
jgi:Cys-tRNA(Pro) deacylase